MSKRRNSVGVFPPVDRERAGRSQGGILSVLQLIGFFVVLAGFAGATTAWASDDIDIDRANWSTDRDRLTVRGDKAPDNATVTLRYGRKEDNGAVLGEIQADHEGEWTFQITGPDPVPCDVTAQAPGRDADDKRVRRAPNDCSNDGGTPPPPQVCDITVNPLELDFGDVAIGTSRSLSTTLSNNGGAACTGSLSLSDGTQFTIDETSNIDVPAGGSQSVSVSYTPSAVGSSDTDTLAVDSNDPDSPTISVGLRGSGIDAVAGCNPSDLDISINSTSQNGCPDTAVAEQPQVPNNDYSVLAINDLGMHCGDLDTRISSILPPFQAMLAQVIRKGSTGSNKPVLNPAGVELYYSAAANPNDPILDSNVFDGMMADGETYKTNFWDFPVPAGTYDPFYPAYNPLEPAQTLTPLAGPPFNVGPDVGLPVPNVEKFYIGTDGQVGGDDVALEAVLHAMPGIAGPYTANDPQHAEEHYTDKPFFINFPFGYVAANVNWYEGAGVPFAAFDDNGRENAYPLVRVEAKNAAGTTLSTVDTVLPISGEASCGNCHAQPADLKSITGTDSRSSDPTDALSVLDDPTTPDENEGVALSMDDPDSNMPPRVSLEYAADINILRLHDLKHGAKYVAPSPDDDGTTVPAPCDITTNAPNGDANCLTSQALDPVDPKPVVCQVCHYTPALDLAQLGPLTGPEGGIANGRNQVSHSSNSNVMHSHHGGLGNLFPDMPAPIQNADGTITNQAERLAVLEDTCYQCHPGTNVQCLRGAMFNGGMLCNDCHGGMEQVGNDFSAGVSPSNPGDFVLDQGNFYDPDSGQPRVPWANEPGCGSCHTGDVRDNLVGEVASIVNTRDIYGNVDNIRLRQAFRTGDAKATPIVPSNKRFAEPAVPASFNGFANPGAGNPQLYRVSTGHGGVMCEGCHGATHAEWPNGNENANDNVTANQLQGHTGTIVECDTCHTNINNLSRDATPSSLRGPHGMHVVGADTDFATSKHKEKLEEGQNKNACRDCHGQNGEGTVLSRMATDRVLECKEETTFCPDGKTALFPKGHAVGCVECHDNGFNHD